MALAEPERYPLVLRLLWNVEAFIWLLVMLALGIAYIVIGHTAGKIVGVALVTAFVAVIVRTALRLRARRPPRAGPAR
jgi:hypothetical protein